MPQSSKPLTPPTAASTREMTQLAENRHVIPRDPPLCDLGSLHAEGGTEIKPRPSPGRRHGSYRSLLCAFIRCPDGNPISLRHEMRDRLNGIGKGCRVLPHKILELFQTPDFDARSRLAMADHVSS